MVLWVLLLAVLVGGGGEAKIALGRRYQSPFRNNNNSNSSNLSVPTAKVACQVRKKLF
jgi:hypothetical protein